MSGPLVGPLLCYFSYMNVTVYALADPETLEVRYVGQSVNPLARLRGHLAEARRHYGNHKKKEWLESLNEDPYVVTLTTTDLADARDVEAQWIERFLEEGHRLTNVHRVKHGRREDARGIGKRRWCPLHGEFHGLCSGARAAPEWRSTQELDGSIFD